MTILILWHVDDFYSGHPFLQRLRLQQEKALGLHHSRTEPIEEEAMSLSGPIVEPISASMTVTPAARLAPSQRSAAAMQLSRQLNCNPIGGATLAQSPTNDGSLSFEECMSVV